ncbi:MAG: cytochrome c oxidase assembly protein [Sphaerobacter sp.]|nr:cytochrome c oxidase assembly protein [Sphaerobacter sp.]
MVIPLLHAASAAIPEAWYRAWHADPLIMLLLGGSAAWYLLAYRAAARAGRRVPPRWQVLAYLGGLVSLAVALLGPPDHFNGVLFSIHMVQHLILMLVAAPLLVLGRPVQVLLRGLRPRHSRALMGITARHPGLRGLLGVVVHPVTVFLLYNGSFLFWHLPGPYQAAVRNDLIHDLEHFAFFGTALLFWWVLIDPVPRHYRLSTTAAALLLFATWMAGDLICATITLSRDLIYPVYAETETPWGLKPLGDQRLGGAIMWASAGLYYAVVLIGLLAAPYLRTHPAGHAGQHA